MKIYLILLIFTILTMCSFS